MRYLLFFFFCASCFNAPQTQTKRQKINDVQTVSVQGKERKRPEYNQKLLSGGKKMENDEFLEQRVRLLNLDLDNTLEQKASTAEKSLSSKDFTSMPNVSKVSEKRIEQISERNEQRSVTKNEVIESAASSLNKASSGEVIKNADVLEISGSQRKLKVPIMEEDLIPPPKRGEANKAFPLSEPFVVESKFIISTSATYSGISLEEARLTLEPFGVVKTVKEGVKFALKIYPKNPIETEEDAKKFLKNIIAGSAFLDLYIERK